MVRHFGGQSKLDRRHRATVAKAIGVVLVVVCVFGALGGFSPSPSSAGGNPADHTFIATLSNGKTPYSWDPCKPIHIVVNERTAIKDGARLVDEAISEVEKATGLSIVLDGSTSERPSSSRPIDVARYRSEDTPVLLAWSDPAESPRLSGRTVGYEKSRSLISIGQYDRRPVYVTGSVTIDGPELSKVARQSNGWARARGVLMHELGHLVGLGHVKARDEIMYRNLTRSQVSWGAGDLAGLAVLGSGTCVI